MTSKEYLEHGNNTFHTFRLPQTSERRISADKMTVLAFLNEICMFCDVPLRMVPYPQAPTCNIINCVIPKVM